MKNDIEAMGLTEIVDDSSEFFAPVSSDVIDMLIGQYQSMRKRIEGIADLIDSETSQAMAYFLDGNKDQNRGSMPSVEQLFNPKGAIACLNSSYWSKAMALTDVYDCMPQARRDEWSKSIREMTAPDFTEEAVRPTISDLLASRSKFFGERVDGIFRGLSGEHVTNSPSGFCKRMIIGYVTEGHFYTSSSKSGLINDLRAVIAKFMGRDEPRWNSSASMINAARRNPGQWMILDGGALRIRCYIKGTAHLEVHPDIAYRLNQVLASLYPMAIPAEFRAKPKKKHKEFQMIGRPLPFAVLEIIGDMRRERGTNSFSLPYGVDNKAAKEEAIRVLASIGGVLREKSIGAVDFDYDPREALDEIITSGCVPDQKAHQYYPTPKTVTQEAIDMADIGDDHTVLEPSAGQGHLASFLPKERTTCVEISGLHRQILEAKGYQVIWGDFLPWANERYKTFDRVVMNPPFSEGRAKAHVEAASRLIADGGRLVAILPASFNGKDLLPGWVTDWSQVFSNEFAGTSVSVVIMRADKP